ncbi:MAG: PQQ-binding-like beta-propeller repeat protein [Anaerolineales bacterium]|nr:PQQ-binding-like beta-propeller repeat protein [Anaerolineales bacterium]
MDKKKLVFTLTIATLLVLNLFTYAQPPVDVSGQSANLLTNGGFETGSVSPWSGISASNLTTSDVYSGSYAVKITSSEAAQGWMNVEVGKEYTLTAWYKWEQFSGSDWGYDRLQVLYDDWTEATGISNIHSSFPQGEWSKVALSFTATKSRVRVNFGMFGPQSSVELYFDELELYEKSGSANGPTLDPSANVTSGDAPLTVNFTANASDPDGAIRDYFWEFGDGSTDVLVNPSHTFVSRGDYQVQLTVWDNDGNQASDTLTISVSDSDAPNVDITGPTSQENHTTSSGSVQLSGTAVSYNGDDITRVVWDNISTDQAGIVTVNASQNVNWNGTVALKPGKNEILITAMDEGGKIGTDRLFVTREFSEPQISNISASATSVKVYEKYEVSFDLATVAENLFFLYDTDPPSGVEPGIGVTVEGVFTTPSGRTLRQPAFMSTEVVRSGEYYEETGDDFWAVRFSPQEIGQYQVSLYVQDASGTVTVPVGSFTATTPTKSGFVQVSDKDTRYFEFSNGDIFWPVGPAINSDYSENDNVGHTLERPWMGGWGAYSTNWARWVSSAQEMGNEGFSSQLNFKEHYPTSELSQELFWPEGNRIWIGWHGGESVVQTRLEANHEYQIKLRIKVEDMSGPTNASYPYGLMLKTHDWPSDNFEQDMRSVASMIPPVNADGDWHTVVVRYTATSADAQHIYLSLYLDNITSGKVYVDQMSIREVLSGGELGGELVVNSQADMHTYVEPRPAAFFDWQVEQGEMYDVFYKYVVFDKNDWVPNHLSASGIFTNSGDGYYQPEGTKTRWLLEQWWRYIIARWGYSTAVHSWELNNEGSPDETTHWQATQDFAKFMHENDSHPHLATTSFWCCWRPEFWGDEQDYPDVDYADVHEYSNDDKTLGYDMANWQLIRGEEYLADSVDMPVMRGETGIGYSGISIFSALEKPNDGIWYHNMLWSQLQAGVLYDPNYWWSEHLQYIDRAAISGPFSDFVDTLDVNYGGYSDIDADVSNNDLRVFGQKNTSSGRAYLWIQNRAHTWRNVMGVDNPQTISPETGNVIIDLVPNTTFTVEWWNTYTGQVTNTQTLNSNSAGEITLAVSGLQDDVAVKIYTDEIQVTATPSPTAVSTIPPTSQATPTPVTQNTPTSTPVTPVSEPTPTPTTVVSGPTPTPLADPASSTDWPQFQHDAQRTGRTSVSVPPNYEVTWAWFDKSHIVHNFVSAPGNNITDGFGSNFMVTTILSQQVQPVVVNGKVYFGATNGVMYAVNALNGNNLWDFQTGAAILGTAAYSDGVLVVTSMDGKIYGLNANTGAKVWEYQTGAGISVSPAIQDGTVYVGSRDGYFYALHASNGALKWKYATRVPGDADSPFALAPIIAPAAVSENGGTVLFGAENMYFYALNTSNGQERWAPKKVVGQSFLHTWPVVTGDKVLVYTMSSLEGAENDSTGMEAVLDNLPANPTWSQEKNAVLNFLDQNPYQKILTVFNVSNGQEPYEVAMGRVTGNNYAPFGPALDEDGLPLMFWRSKHATLFTDQATFGTKYCSDISYMDPATGDRITINNPSSNKLSCPEIDNGFQPTIGGDWLYLYNQFRGANAINLVTGQKWGISATIAVRDCSDWRGGEFWGYEIIYYGNDGISDTCNAADPRPPRVSSNPNGFTGIVIAETDGVALLYLNDSGIGGVVAIEEQR